MIAEVVLDWKPALCLLLMVPIVLALLWWEIYSFLWLENKSYERFKAIGSVRVGYALLLCLVVGFGIAGWFFGYYNTSQEKAHIHTTGGIWHDSQMRTHHAPYKDTYHDENQSKRFVGYLFMGFGAYFGFSLAVLLTNWIYSLVKKRIHK